MGAEAYAFLDTFDAMYSIYVEVAYVLDMQLPIFMFTDSR